MDNSLEIGAGTYSVDGIFAMEEMKKLCYFLLWSGVYLLRYCNSNGAEAWMVFNNI